MVRVFSCFWQFRAMNLRWGKRCHRDSRKKRKRLVNLCIMHKSSSVGGTFIIFAPMPLQNHQWQKLGLVDNINKYFLQNFHDSSFPTQFTYYRGNKSVLLFLKVIEIWMIMNWVSCFNPKILMDQNICLTHFKGLMSKVTQTQSKNAILAFLQPIFDANNEWQLCNVKCKHGNGTVRNVKTRFCNLEIFLLLIFALFEGTTIHPNKSGKLLQSESNFKQLFNPVSAALI